MSDAVSNESGKTLKFARVANMTSPVICFVHAGDKAVEVKTGFRSALELDYEEAHAVFEWLGRALGVNDMAALTQQLAQLQAQNTALLAREKLLEGALRKARIDAALRPSGGEGEK